MRLYGGKALNTEKTKGNLNDNHETNKRLTPLTVKLIYYPFLVIGWVIGLLIYKCLEMEDD